jgi:hypothetical protein
MMVRAVLILGLLLLASCQTLSAEAQRSFCGYGDHRAWTRIDQPASHAESMRALADAHPNFPGSNAYGRETWYALPEGNAMLCRSDEAPRDSCSGQWWQFRLSGDQPEITAQDAWICVT